MTATRTPTSSTRGRKNPASPGPSRANPARLPPKESPMHCCCTGGDPAAPAVPAHGSFTAWLRRIATLTQWALPLTTLAVIPKCPACVAAYVLLLTGIGLSLPAAAAVRWALIALSVAGLAYLLLRAVRRALTPPAYHGCHQSLGFQGGRAGPAHSLDTKGTRFVLGSYGVVVKDNAGNLIQLSG